MAPGAEPLVTLRSVYEQQCDALQCKKNSYLLKALAGLDFGALTVLDLNLNFVGRVGVRAVLGVAKAAPNLWKLCLADNFLTNDSIKEIVRVLHGHPNLQYLDLSRNPISHVAAKALSSYISDNPKVHTVLLSDTLITPAMLRTIQSKLEGRKANAVVVDETPAAQPIAAPEEKKQPTPPPEPPARPSPVPSEPAAPPPPEDEAELAAPPPVPPRQALRQPPSVPGAVHEPPSPAASPDVAPAPAPRPLLPALGPHDERTTPALGLLGGLVTNGESSALQLVLDVAASPTIAKLRPLPPPDAPPSPPAAPPGSLGLVFDLVAPGAWADFASLGALQAAAGAPAEAAAGGAEQWQAMSLVWDVAQQHASRVPLGLASIMALVHQRPGLLKDMRAKAAAQEQG